MKPRAATGKKGGGEGTQPVDYMKGGERSPPYPVGQPAGNKPASIAGYGSTPPAYARSQSVSTSGVRGDYAKGAKEGLGNPTPTGPDISAGQMPPSGGFARPARITPPTDKSRDKSVGVE